MASKKRPCPAEDSQEGDQQTSSPRRKGSSLHPRPLARPHRGTWRQAAQANLAQLQQLFSNPQMLENAMRVYVEQRSTAGVFRADADFVKSSLWLANLMRPESVPAFDIPMVAPTQPTLLSKRPKTAPPILPPRPHTPLAPPATPQTLNTPHRIPWTLLTPAPPALDTPQRIPWTLFTPAPPAPTTPSTPSTPSTSFTPSTPSTPSKPSKSSSDQDCVPTNGADMDSKHVVPGRNSEVWARLASLTRGDLEISDTMFTMLRRTEKEFFGHDTLSYGPDTTLKDLVAYARKPQGRTDQDELRQVIIACVFLQLTLDFAPHKKTRQSALARWETSDWTAFSQHHGFTFTADDYEACNRLRYIGHRYSVFTNEFGKGILALILSLTTRSEILNSPQKSPMLDRAMEHLRRLGFQHTEMAATLDKSIGKLFQYVVGA